MADLHMDDFCRDTALILVRLFGSFPRPASLYVEDFAGPDQRDEVGLHSARHLSGLGTLLWLGEEGYLRYQDLIYQEGIDQAVLTRAALVRLLAGSPVDQTPWYQLLREALREGHSEYLGRLVQQFLALPLAELPALSPVRPAAMPSH